ncbi:MAG: hypothetical protein U9R52_01700 [Candidatus Omnitrophota bacterium]|nr:hypothetical protein [Candidatus Omnitrophota bacterium]
MRLSRYFMILSVVTCLGICYSHQQFILIRANYAMQFHKNRLSQLLDRNEKLMYNIAALESPANLEEKLKNNGMDYDVAGRWFVRAGARTIKN